MIVVAEGPSAAGKTTWLKRFALVNVVPESPVAVDAPDRNIDPQRAESYWAARNAERWALAVRIERAGDTAYCDTDPFKLHYVWSLWQIGAVSRESWLNAVRLHRDMVARVEVGFADLVLVSIPGLDDLRLRKDKDSTRTRRHFDLHARLGEPLRAWYEAIDSLSPGRVVWEFPKSTRTVEQLLTIGRRNDRYSLEFFDALVTRMNTDLNFTDAECDQC